jgi:hypothetical protein
MIAACGVFVFNANARVGTRVGWSIQKDTLASCHEVLGLLRSSSRFHLRLLRSSGGYPAIVQQWKLMNDQPTDLRNVITHRQEHRAEFDQDESFRPVSPTEKQIRHTFDDLQSKELISLKNMSDESMGYQTLPCCRISICLNMSSFRDDSHFVLSSYRLIGTCGGLSANGRSLM